jgi:hypothetical protein
MQPEQLGAACACAIISGTNITLVLPEGEKWPQSWPRGELLCVTDKGRAYSFDPLKILGALQKMAKLNNGYQQAAAAAPDADKGE